MSPSWRSTSASRSGRGERAVRRDRRPDARCQLRTVDRYPSEARLLRFGGKDKCYKGDPIKEHFSSEK